MKYEFHFLPGILTRCYADTITKAQKMPKWVSLLLFLKNNYIRSHSVSIHRQMYGEVERLHHGFERLKRKRPVPSVRAQ